MRDKTKSRKKPVTAVEHVQATWRYVRPPWYSVLKQKFDFFAIAPVPRFEGRKKYGTTVGLLASFLVLGIVVSYAVFVVFRLVTGDRGTVTLIDVRDTQAIEFVPFEVEFPHLSDPRYFNLSVQHRISRPGERSSKEEVPMAGLSSSSTSRLDILRTVAGHREQNILSGDCKTEVCRYIRIKLYPCQNGTFGTPPGGCASPEAIEQILNFYYFIVRIETTDTRGSATVETTYELSLKSSLSFRQIFPFRRHDLREGANYLTSWRQFEKVTLQSAAPIFSIDRLPRETTGADTEYMKLDFMLNALGTQEHRAYQTSMDTMGEIAAFFSAMLGIFGVFITTFNSKTFYRKYPAWAGFDGSFQKCQTEEQAAAEEAFSQAIRPPPLRTAIQQSDEPLLDGSSSDGTAGQAPIAVVVTPNKTTDDASMAEELDEFLAASNVKLRKSSKKGQTSSPQLVSEQEQKPQQTKKKNERKQEGYFASNLADEFI